MTDQWVVVFETVGEMEAVIVQGLLQAQGFKTMLVQEGAGRAMGFTVGPLGIVQLLVPASQLDQARTVLQDYQSGSFEEPDGNGELEDGLEE